MSSPAPHPSTWSSPGEEAERLQQFITAVTDYAIYMLSPEGLVVSWNAGAARFKGYTAEEIIGRHFSTFYTDEDRATDLPARALNTAATEGRFEAEGWRVRKDGSRFWAHVVIDPIRGDAGELLGFAKVTRDITERRNAQIALEQAREALHQSQKLEALGKLTGGIAHDFNNLLNVMANGMALLRHRLSDPADLRILDTMERASTRGANLTQQLLSFARQQPLKRERRDLSRVISGFEPVLRRASRNAIAFELRLAVALPAVMIDVTQFEAALLNLVVNARDATPDGGRITVATTAVELEQGAVGQLPAGRYVRVAVSDTGTGMAPEVAARAVEPFFTTKEVGQGTGLGLSQVYGMAQQSNGDIAIETRAGEGTAVSLYFPVAQGTDGGVDGDTDPGHEKALVVDDQPDVLDITSELFRSLGYEVFAANSGEDAMEILRRTPDIGVLFSDVVMPGMSGIELGRKAREMAPQIKVILASGYAMPALRSNAAGLDDFEFVAKPYRIADIMRKLRAHH